MRWASKSARDGAALLILSLVGLAQAPRVDQHEARLERIAAMSDRAASGAAEGWRHELAGRAAEARIGALLRAVAEGDEAALALFFAPGAARELTTADPPLESTHGRLKILRRTPEASPGTDPAAYFSDLAVLLRQEARVELEVDAVSAPARDRIATSSLLRVFAAGAGIQRNERWEIDWSTAPDQEPRIERLRRALLESVQASGPVFRDCTASVLGPGGASDPLLTFGGDWWSQRVDAVGESNAFGHQGMAIGDVNGDGLEDLYVAMGTGLPNRLYLHQPDGTVREAAAEAGIAWYDDTKGVLLLDLDGDGDDDLVCAMGPALVVHENDGQGRFQPERMLRPGSDAAFYSLSAADPDLDGDLDLYACRYVKATYGESIPLPFQDARNGPPNHLLRNDGKLRFTDVTGPAGMGVHNDRFSTAAAWMDYDLDGDCDLYVSNDFGRNNLYRNDKGRFVDVAAELGVDDPAAGMGVSFGDVDGDGRPDLYVSNMRSAAGLRAAGDPRFRPADPTRLRNELAGHAMGNQLFLGRPQGPWSPAGDALDVRRGGWSWGGQLADLDLDGRLDLLVPNGFLSGPLQPELSGFFWREVAARSPASAQPSEPYEDGWIAVTRRMNQGQSWAGGERDACFLNVGSGRFADVGAAAGIDLPGDARAMVLVDWDGDGDQDVWISSRTAPRLRFLRNDLPQGSRSLGLRLRGVSANRDGIGARVELHAGGRRLVRWVVAGDGYLSQSSRWLVFGLGSSESVERAIVHWPGGAQEQIQGLEPGGRYRYVQGSGRAVLVDPREESSLAPGALALGTAEPPGRAILRTPLRLPPRLARHLRDGASGPLVVELPRQAAGAAARERDGLSWRVVAPDDPLRPAWDVLVEHLIGGRPAAVGGVALLIDVEDKVQAAYPGAPDTEGLLQDARTLGSRPGEPSPRTSRPGLWFFGAPRDLETLARRMESAGQPEEATFYRDPRSRR